MSDLTERLRHVAWLAEEGSEVTDLAAAAADALEAAEAWKAEATTVIERWEACWDVLAGELSSPVNLGRSKADLVREWIVAAEAKLVAIDALHTPEDITDDVAYCCECDTYWPCPAARILHPEEER